MTIFSAKTETFWSNSFTKRIDLANSLARFHIENRAFSYLFDGVDTLQPLEIVSEIDFVSFGCVELAEGVR